MINRDIAEVAVEAVTNYIEKIDNLPMSQRPDAFSRYALQELVHIRHELVEIRKLLEAQSLMA